MKPVSYYLKRFDSLYEERSHWNSQWQEAARRLIPAHVDTFHTKGRLWTKGRKRTEEIYDATAALALYRFQSVMESLATPANNMWHRLEPSEDRLRKDRVVRAYLDEVNRIVMKERYRPKANFVGQNQKTLFSYGAYGNGITFVDARPEGGVRYKNLALGQTYFLENHQGIVDTMYRRFQMTARHIIAEYGEDVPASVLKHAENPNLEDHEFDILHVVEPNPNYKPGKLGVEGMEFHSVHIFIQEDHLLRRAGYTSFPSAVCRYTQFAGETYGRGPAQLVLPSIKLLNAQKKTVLKQGNRIVDPVLLAHDDGLIGSFSLKSGAINPGGVNADGRLLVQPLPTGNLAVGEKMMEMEKQTINDAFLITLFQILTEGPRMTATEVLERTREKGLLIAPTAGRLQAEYLGPLIEREIDILAKQGILPPPPPQLIEAGGVYTVEYDSPMSRMMRAENASGFQRSLETAANVAKLTGDISIMDHFNFDNAIPDLNDINGMPVAWSRTPEEVAALRQSREQQQQQQMMIENAHSLAGAMKAAGDMGGEEPTA